MHCLEVAARKKAAHRHEEYWGRPVAGFGDARARILVVGLAPAAHGANRTGRVFTGDGSGDFLMRALYDAGYASLPVSRRPDDGLRLRDVYITAAVRCAPPDNKPAPEEIRACLPHLIAEAGHLPHVEVVVALGRIAFDAWLLLLKERGSTFAPRPRFGHGLVHRFPPPVPALVASYHPSRQNTNTGRLTAAMLQAVFRTAAALTDTRLRQRGDEGQSR
jgi:uracil-DNA glycosylase